MGETIEQVEAKYNAIVLSTLPQVSQEAIKKLKDSKTDKQSYLIMIGLVLAIAEGDETLAQKALDENKTIDTCREHVVNWAKKQAIKNAAMINHEDVWSEAIHYFLDVEEKPKYTPKFKKTTMQLPVQDIEKPSNDGCTSLFGDDDDFEKPTKDDNQMSLFGNDF